MASALALPAGESRTLRAILPRWAIPVSCGLFGVFPDFDTITMRAFDIPYRSFFGHRGFFHSPFFLTLFAALIAALVARNKLSTLPALASLWAAAAITHPLLDMLTDGGGGVMVLFPFSTRRLFFPWRPIHVSPLEISRFGAVAGRVLRSELPFCLAAIGIGAAVWAAVRFASASGNASAARIISRTTPAL